MPTITINFAADELETVQDVLSMLNGRAELAKAKTIIAAKEDEPQGSIYDQIENARKTREEEVAEKTTELAETIEHTPAPADEPTEEKPKKTRTRRSKNPTQQEVKEAVKAAKANYGEQFCFDAAEAAGATLEDTLLKTIREMDKTLYKGFISTLTGGDEALAQSETQVKSEDAPVNTTGSLFEESDSEAETSIEEPANYPFEGDTDAEELATDDDDDWATDDEPEAEAEAEKVKIDPAGVQQALRAYAQKDRAAAREVLKASGAKTIGAVLELPQDKLLEIMKAVS